MSLCKILKFSCRRLQKYFLSHKSDKKLYFTVGSDVKNLAFTILRHHCSYPSNIRRLSCLRMFTEVHEDSVHLLGYGLPSTSRKTSGEQGLVVTESSGAVFGGHQRRNHRGVHGEGVSLEVYVNFREFSTVVLSSP